MKQIGITGAAGSGKTTVFRAATGGRVSGNVVAVSVPDHRLDTLVQLHSSRKTAPVHLDLIDVHAAERTEAAALGHLRKTDALVLVVAGFADRDLAAEFRSLTDTLVLADLAPFEARIERARKDPAVKPEVESLEAALEVLNAGKMLAGSAWEIRDLRVFSGLAPLTLKPMVVVANVDDKRLGEPLPQLGPPTIGASALLEAEAASLESDDAREVLSGYGVAEPLSERLPRALFEALDVVVYFTAGEKETRAVEVPRGATAPEAAGHLHSDMQRGFIRAEVIPFEKVREAGSWDAAKAAKKARAEGKDYVVRDGDVILFRFSV